MTELERQIIEKDKQKFLNDLKEAKEKVLDLIEDKEKGKELLEDMFMKMTVAVAMETFIKAQEDENFMDIVKGVKND